MASTRAHLALSRSPNLSSTLVNSRCLPWHISDPLSHVTVSALPLLLQIGMPNRQHCSIPTSAACCGLTAHKHQGQHHRDCLAAWNSTLVALLVMYKLGVIAAAIAPRTNPMSQKSVEEGVQSRVEACSSRLTRRMGVLRRAPAQHWRYECWRHAMSSAAQCTSCTPCPCVASEAS